MSWINAKSLAAIAAAALLAGAAGYLAQKQKTDQLQTRMDAALAQLEQAKAVNQTAQEALAARDQQLQKLQAASTELARARNQIAQFQQQRDTAARSAPPPAGPAPKPAAPAAFPPGTYVGRAQLSFAGYSTPEAVIQSLAWGAVNGQSDIIPHVIPTDLEGGQDLAKALETALQDAGPAFAGMQIMAEKVLDDDRLEVMVKLDMQPVPGGSADLPPPLNILPMVRVDNEWKLGGSPQNYSENWPNTGQIKTFVQ